MAHNFAQGGGYGHPGTYQTGHHPPPPPQQQGNPYGNYQQPPQQNVFAQNAAHALSQFNTELQLFESKKSQAYHGVQARELKEILDQAPSIRNFYGITWSLELCKIMIAMLDRSKDGFLQYKEFVELLQCLNTWLHTFQQFDHDRSNFIDSHELCQCIIHKFKYALSEKTLTALLKRYSCAMDDGRILIAFDDFVALSVRLRAYTEAFRARDKMQHQGQETGNTMFGYDDFLQCVMCL